MRSTPPQTAGSNPKQLTDGLVKRAAEHRLRLHTLVFQQPARSPPSRRTLLFGLAWRVNALAVVVIDLGIVKFANEGIGLPL